MWHRESTNIAFPTSLLSFFCLQDDVSENKTKLVIESFKENMVAWRKKVKISSLHGVFFAQTTKPVEWLRPKSDNVIKGSPVIYRKYMLNNKNSMSIVNDALHSYHFSRSLNLRSEYKHKIKYSKSFTG